MKVFLSGVSSEFATVRSVIATDLQKRACEPRFQDVLRQETASATTLQKLHDQVRSCDAVVCLIGKRSGLIPPEAAVTPEFKAMLPEGITRASYTQWEYFFGRAMRKRTSFYIASDAFQPDAAALEGDDPRLQAAFVAHLKAKGLDRSYCADTFEFRINVMWEDWPPATKVIPINLPFSSIRYLFKGRIDFLRDLRTSLTGGHTTAITTKALHGLGGVGKTRTAIEYAWAHELDYNALLFVGAETPELLRQNIAALCEASTLNLPEMEVQKEDVRFAAALRWLNANRGWLMVIDNADTPESAIAVERILPKLTHGHVLLTSRRDQWSAQIERHELQELDADSATAFVLARTDKSRRKTPTDKEDACALARDVDGLALALEQAGAYISKEVITIAEYRAAWKSNETIDWDDPNRAQLMQYPKNVARTWATSVAKLSENAREFLRMLAWLAPEPIPLLLLDIPIEEIEGRINVDPKRALKELAEYSLAQRSGERPEFTVHRLVQEVTRRGLLASDPNGALERALRWINVASVGDADDVRTWPTLTPIVPHAVAVATHADSDGVTDPTARLMGQLHAYFSAQARFAEAEPFSRRALAIAENSYGPNHRTVAICLNNLANLLRATNRLGEAESLFRHALAITEKSDGPDHPSRAIRLNNLAGLLQETNRRGEAEQLYRRALAITEKSDGPNHPSVANRLNNLAGLLRATNRLGESELLYRRALAITENSYGPDHPDVANRLNNLAGLLRATNRLGEAEPLNRRALAITEKAYGPNHPNVATCLNNLAGLLRATNRLGEAEPIFRRAVAINEKSYGPDHPDVAICLSNLADLLRATNRLGEAEPLNRRALAITEKSYAPDHPSVAIRLVNLAGLLMATNRLSEAEPLFRRALAIDEKSYGPDHPEVATDLNNLGRLLHETNRLGEAEPLFHRALAIDEKSYGPDHPGVATDLINLAGILLTTNRLGEAAPLFRRALGILIRFTVQTGHEHPNLDRAIRNYASALSALGRSAAQIHAEIEKIKSEGM